jgi:signal peptidase I
MAALPLHAPPSPADSAAGPQDPRVAVGGAAGSAALSALAAMAAARASAAAAPAAPGWSRVLQVAVARVALTLVASLLLWTLLPLAVGWAPRVIMSGSMEPRIHMGDIVVTRTVPAASLHEGQVVTVKDPDHPGRTRTHRVLRREAGGVLVLKGDANRDADSTRVSVDDVRGVGVVRVPYVGRPATWLAQRSWMALGATALFLGWCVVTVLPAPRTRDDMVFA